MTIDEIVKLVKQLIIRKGFLYTINLIYYSRLFCTTHEHCNYLQLILTIKMETLYKRSLMVASLIKCGREEKNISLH